MKQGQRQQKQQEQKALRQARAEAFVPVQRETLDQLVARHANRPVVHVQTSRELRAEAQEKLAGKLGTVAVSFVVVGNAEAAGHLAMNAVGKANNAWRLRNPEPMMQAVHRFFLEKNGCFVPKPDKPLVF
jgi:hypothetical protein